MVGPGRAGLAAAMGSPPVVMGLILGRDRPQMPLAEDEHPVGDLGPGGEHEPFRISVHPRRLDRRADNPDARSLEHRIECGGEAGVPVVQDKICPCPGVFQVHEQVPGLLHYL